MRVLNSFTGITNNIFTSNDSNLLKLLIEKTIPKVVKMQRVHASTSNKVMSKTIYKDIKRFSNKKLRGYYGY